MNKQAAFKTKGMQRDLSVSAFNSEYAYENKNIRIGAIDNNTLFSITNEKGPRLVNTQHTGGTPIGSAVIDNELIMFFTDVDTLTTSMEDTSYLIDPISDVEFSVPSIGSNTFNKIVSYKYNNDEIEETLLYEGDLNLNENYPIETLISYENNKIKKVYWTDNLNPPRFINIATPADKRALWNKDSFDWTQKMKLEEEVTIERIESGGIFSGGTIQYAFTYFNYYGQESNIFNSSSLYYTSHINRGAAADETTSNSFKITIENVDTNFEYVRIYSIFRSSYGNDNVVKKVADIKLEETPYKSHTYTINMSDRQDVYLVDNNGRRISVEDFLNTSYWHDNLEITNPPYIRVEDSIRNKYFNIPDDYTVFIIIDNNKIVFEIETGGVLEISGLVNKIEYIDTNTTGEIIDVYDLLYKGGDDIIFSTFNQKDNTLFVGDYTLKRKIIPDSIKRAFRELPIDIEKFSLYQESPVGFYPYKSQLNKSSSDIKIFKTNEKYKLGVQFQYDTGNWSEAIPITEDAVVTEYPTAPTIDSKYVSYSKFYTEIISNQEGLINELLQLGIRAVRPVIVYPDFSNRECICQGVLCPTVYNALDRYNNRPFAQSSWFFRPNAPVDLERAENPGILSEWSKDINNLISTSSGSVSKNSRYGLVNLENNISITSNWDTENSETYTIPTDAVDKGSWIEFRHNHSLPTNIHRNCEIQCNTTSWDRSIITGTQYPEDPYIENSSINTQAWCESNKDVFFVDQSIVTLHSPDIEYNKELDNYNYSNAKLRIVGLVPFTSFDSNITMDYTAPESVVDFVSNIGFYNKDIKSYNDYPYNRFGYRTRAAGYFWIELVKESESVTNRGAIAIYPFNKEGNVWGETSKINSVLNNKDLLNYKFSYNNYYLDEEQSITFNNTSIFNINPESSPLVVLSPTKSYYSNVDTSITTLYEYKSAEVHNKISYDEAYYSEFEAGGAAQPASLAPIRMIYKTTPHVVIDLNSNDTTINRILPTLTDSYYLTTETERWKLNDRSYNEHLPFWKRDDYNSFEVIQQSLNINFKNFSKNAWATGVCYGWLWIGELYREVENKFRDSLNENWKVCGKAIPIKKNTSIRIRWEEGDTYYQRYDCLKTYTDQGVVNGIKDIASFLCETRVNLDGRIDRNRGVLNMSINPNIIKRNNVYDNGLDYFTYHILDPNAIEVNTFNNRVLQGKTKVLGETTDSWVNFKIVNDIDFDGDLGKITSIKRLNNQLLVFQNKGISQLLYNENAQISASEGVPIYLSNSGTVQGKRYITNTIGCTNKYSICETSSGLYFIDDNTKSIYLFSGELNNISNKLGFNSWIHNNLEDVSDWKPKSFNNFVTYYDRINKEVLFVNKETCLAFNEQLGQFTSFYDYDKVLYFSTLNKGSLEFRNSNGSFKLYEHNKGEYNQFFGTYKPFYTTVVANPTPITDKIFNTIEFRADVLDDNNKLLTPVKKPFDTIRVWNEYQDTNDISLSTTNATSGLWHSNLKQKFRIWRANIPRNSNSISGRIKDRIRNPWAYIKLSNTGNNTDKIILHDIVVNYIE